MSEQLPAGSFASPAYRNYELVTRTSARMRLGAFAGRGGSLIGDVEQLQLDEDQTRTGAVDPTELVIATGPADG